MPIRKLSQALKNKSYQVKTLNIDWKKPLSLQTVKPVKNATIVGFSLGAVIAYLMASKYECKKILLASMTPIHKYSQSVWISQNKIDMNDVQAIACAKDISKIKIDLNSLKTEYVVIAGELEDPKKVYKPDILIPKTDHHMNNAYIKAIAKII